MNVLFALVMAVTLTQTWESPSPPDAVYVGPATRYDKDLMPDVFVTRGIISDTSEYDSWLADHGYVGAVALARKGDLYRSVWIDGEGPFYVADCRQLAHFPGKHVVEVDWRTAMRWLERGPWPEAVTVAFKPPVPSRIGMVR